LNRIPKQSFERDILLVPCGADFPPLSVPSWQGLYVRSTATHRMKRGVEIAVVVFDMP
jgi:hypothetical protein